jgi:type I restriction enzyme S subunit
MRESYSKYKSTEIPWMPEMPDHWEIRKTKYLFRLVTEQAEQNNTHELLSLYTDIGVKPRKELKAAGNKASTTDFYWLVKKGDIVVNKLLAWMGAIGISHYDGVTSPAYDVLRKRVELESTYYDFLFRCGLLLTDFKRRSKGIMEMRLRLYFDELGQIKLPVPPIDEQIAIVNYLNVKFEQINRFIATKEKLIFVLKEQKQSLLTELIQDKAGKWEKSKLKFIAKIIFSNVDKHTLENEVEVELCNYTDVYKNEFIDNTLSYMKASASMAEINRFKLEVGDVLVTKDSETANDIACPALVVEVKENLICGYHLAQIKPKKKLLGEFLFRIFQSKYFNQHFEINANGVTRVGLSISAFTDFVIPLPTIEEQTNIVKTIKQEYSIIEATIERIEKEIEKVKELKQSLIAEVVTGKIKVS